MKAASLIIIVLVSAGPVYAQYERIIPAEDSRGSVPFLGFDLEYLF